ncbi:unnamed protein product, partial [Mesorhabditis spiculigera]
MAGESDAERRRGRLKSVSPYANVFMRLRQVPLTICVMACLLFVHVYPSTSTSAQLDSTQNDLSGFHRMRLRAHRRRHRQKHGDKDHDELAELLEKKNTDNVERKRNPKNAETRERNEELCAVERETIELNNARFEYEPPFIEHVRCRIQAEYGRREREHMTQQTCVHGLLRCVQRYSERHVTRRARHSDTWEPYTITDVPTACECMWPADRYGHLEL